MVQDGSEEEGEESSESEEDTEEEDTDEEEEQMCLPGMDGKEEVRCFSGQFIQMHIQWQIYKK